MVRDRQEEIRSKGFNIVDTRYRGGYEGPVDYNSIKIGMKRLEDAVLNLGSLRKIPNRGLGDKQVVLRAIAEHNLPLMRSISEFFYNTSGIYSRVCDYFAFMYRYDWYVVPEIFDKENEKLTEKILTEFDNVLTYLDNSHVKKLCGDIALDVIKYGAYYGYIVPSPKGLVLQQLPLNYCRSRFSIGDIPVVEFNMAFFDECFRDVNYRIKVLKLFPEEFRKGYLLYKQGKLTPEYIGDDTFEAGIRHINGYGHGWYPLDPGNAVKFCFKNGDQPLFINAIPSIIDLDAGQDLDRRKQMQELMKIVIQKLPLDKNGDLIFDVDEARDIHNNAVEMLQHAIGVDVLTTFADVDIEDVADKNSNTSNSDGLERIERTVYNSFGVSRNLFNTDGNLSLEKSILDDEATLKTLLLQFNTFFDKVASALGKNKKKYNFRLYMLETTQYNYKEMAKLFKEQEQIGKSKMLAQIALGLSQSSILHTAYFENNVLHLSELMIPPLMSSTLNADAILGKKEQSNSSNSQKSSEGTKTQIAAASDKAVGRPEKSDDQKSEKTIANRESMN